MGAREVGQRGWESKLRTPSGGLGRLRILGGKVNCGSRIRNSWPTLPPPPFGGRDAGGTREGQFRNPENFSPALLESAPKMSQKGHRKIATRAGRALLGVSCGRYFSQRVLEVVAFFCRVRGSFDFFFEFFLSRFFENFLFRSRFQEGELYF